MASMTLKKIFDEPLLFKGFGDFCKVQHAYENLEFWLAVDLFRETFRDQREPSLATSPLSPARKSTRRTFWNALTSQTLSRTSSQNKIEEKDIAAQAKQIYELFLAANAEKWVCVDQTELEEIKRKLDANQIDYKIFDVVQKQVYINMEKDLLPRFSKTFEVEETVFQPAPRGSVRFVPDQKLRATLVKTVTSSEE